MKNNKYIITAALPYTNGDIHIGHLSGVFLPADIYNRYLKLNNKDTIFISGSDEHGASILIKSINENKSPIDIINKYHKKIKYNLRIFKISLDNYFRTSNKIHKKFALKVFYKLYKKNFFINKDTYQYYDNIKKIFLADRFIIGICPICNYNNAYSDICDKCGTTLKIGDLINPISILTKKEPILKKTNNLFLIFKKEYIKYLYSKYKKLNFNKKILKYIYNFIKIGIKKRSITRDINWGIYIKKINKFKRKVIYVWFEAILGYISSTIDLSFKRNINYIRYWKSKDTKLINFIGKDNIVFHSIFYPIIIKNYNKNYILPYYINVNEFLKINGEKISTSKNKGIFIGKFIKYLPKYIDSLRYTLIKEMPINKDSNFTWDKFKYHNNSELIGILGNYFNRIINLIHIKLNGYIPKNKKINKYDKYILNKVNKNIKNIDKYILNYNFRMAINKFIDISRIGNKYLSMTSPWKVKNNEYIKKILYVSLEILKIIIRLSYIFLPYTYKKFLKILNINESNLVNNKIVFPLKHKINKPKIIFFYITDNFLNRIRLIFK
ncbi:MAG: methionine--tRNA ligase [Candidatus Shikimatogenerans bostrichidophilus]|nr:MAG: methionine--tRNA ligase [Candidatus Shikimatogenerans bostrichidophilus]